MFSRFFIERPVLSNVIALLMILIGLVALMTLPVAQYPNVTPPTVQVTTRYPGASAQTIVETVAQPIEQKVNGVQGMIYMQSTSASDGSYSLTVTFEIGTDGDLAQVLVQNRVSSALASLPAAVQTQGVVTQKKSTAILQIITLSSTDSRHDGLFLSNYASINLADELARLPGVGNVTVFGAGSYGMRIWLDPEKLKARGLLPADVIQAIQRQSQQVASGQLGMSPAPSDQNFQYTVNIRGRLDSPSQFEDIIVKTDPGGGGRITRVRDVGRVELGAQTYSQDFTYDGRPSAGLAIYQLPEANALTVAQAVETRMAELAKSLPPGMEYAVPFDTTKFVKAAVKEVYKTLIEAGLLVLLVIFIFLQNWRATLVPATTVPVTIIGAFAAMSALGFTVNLSTLFAIVLSIGIVVDDAIVVVEGAYHYIEKGMPAKDATIKAMSELFGPIVGITLVLISVFLPAAFLPGITGQLYKQFALVIAATAVLSAINAATLKPTQCALWLRPPPARKNAFYRGFNKVFDAIERRYAGLVTWMVHRSGVMAVIAFLLMGFAAWGLTKVPTGFLPIEDQGYVLVSVQLPPAASLERTKRTMAEVTRILQATPGVEHVVSIGGVSALDNNASLANAGVAYVILKDWSKRGAGQDLPSLYRTLSQGLSALDDGSALVLIPPPIQGVGNSGGFTMVVELKDGSGDYAKLERVSHAVVSAAESQSGLQRLNSAFRAGVPQVYVDIDRVKAEHLGVSVGDVFAALQTFVGSSYVNQFNRFGRTFQVYAQADAGFRLRPEDLANLQVRTKTGGMVPIATLTEIRMIQGPSLVSLYNLYPAATVVGSPAAGFSSGQANQLMEEIASRTLPPGMGFEWSAMSYQEQQVGSQTYFIFALAMLLVYMVLAGQYESWWAPAGVILSVPLALLGTVVALLMVGIANNLYVQIGLVLLIALASKNAILIVEHARDARRHHGTDIIEAAVGAARARFRPIIMTSFAFILGVVPLVIATGAGASARKSIGIAVFSGMLASTCLAVLFVPSFYVIFQRLEERRARKAAPVT
ncbi:MAG: multidrug efflux RND transporter permease subunit [Azospirillum sp.]|nr:multidrug efflux RND transporter permease subunit [Azospirillum sp.]